MKVEAAIADFLRQGVELATGEPAQVEISTKGDLWLELRDGYGHDLLDHVAYTADGPEGSLSGRTDDKGQLKHAGIKLGIYKLTIGDVKIQVPVQRPGATQPQIRWIGHVPAEKG
jgi:hypothetical protein